MKVISHSPEETRRIGLQLGRLARPGDVFLLIGGLGAGKTCFAQGIALGLDITGYVTSPSFVVINQYRGRLPMYHIDLYRLDTMEEVIELGLDDYSLHGQGVCVVEWAEKAHSLLPGENMTIEMDIVSDNSRTISLKANGHRYLEMLSKLSTVLGVSKG